MDRYRRQEPEPTWGEAIGGLLVLAFIGWIGYMIFFYEDPYVTKARAACVAEGGVLEKRRNAIQTNILPFAAENFHHACRKPRG